MSAMAALAGWREEHASGFDELKYGSRIFFKDRLAAVGLAIIVMFVAVAVFAPWLAPYPEQGRGKSDLSHRYDSPSLTHPMGTDGQGRDVLSRVIYGARIPLMVSFAVTFAIVLIGVPLGGIAGYFGGRIDEVIMRITDIFLAFPSLLLAMVMVAFMGASLRNAMIAIVVSWWPWYTRLVRSLAVSLRSRPYVEAAKTMGVGPLRIILRHILPNAIGPVIVEASLDVGTVILALAALSFIGLGAKAPAPEWGLQVAEGQDVFLSYWWICTFPGLAILLLVLAFNLVGDGLRDVLDPKLKR